jgi:GGDEF domain-containing protein
MNMANINRKLILLLIYLFCVFSLEQVDGGSIFYFRPLFYAVIFLVVTTTIAVPFVRRSSIYSLLFAWAALYLVLWFLPDAGWFSINRNLQMGIVEFLLIEGTVWVAHELARGLDDLETAVNNSAYAVFPARVMDLEDAKEYIKIEITRSRRHNRPLTVLAIHLDINTVHEIAKASYSGVQMDMFHRYTVARLAQVIDDQARQTDLILLEDKMGRFIVLLPETDIENSSVLAERIAQSVQNELRVKIAWGVASFPKEALTFEDLVQVAKMRLLDVEQGIAGISASVRTEKKEAEALKET